MKQTPPAPSPAKLAERKRLAMLLRENLKRRKAQVRLRDSNTPDKIDPEHENSVDKCDEDMSVTLKSFD